MSPLAALLLVTFSWSHSGLNTDGSPATLASSSVVVWPCTDPISLSEHVGPPLGPTSIDLPVGTWCAYVTVTGENGIASGPSEQVQKVVDAPPPPPPAHVTVKQQVVELRKSATTGKWWIVKQLAGKVPVGLACIEPMLLAKPGPDLYEVPRSALSIPPAATVTGKTAAYCQ